MQPLRCSLCTFLLLLASYCCLFFQQQMSEVSGHCIVMLADVSKYVFLKIPMWEATLWQTHTSME